MDLVDFLRARLDDDEEMASVASPGPWGTNAEHDEVLAVDGETVADGFALSNRQLRATVDHIARHDPTRVLREVEVKRLILEKYRALIEDFTHADETVIEYARRQILDEVIEILALPYSDHKEFREDWRP